MTSPALTPGAIVPGSRAAWAFAFMSIVWGASYLLIKVAIDGGLPAVDVAWIRVAIAALVLVAPAWRAGTLRSLRGRWRWIAAYAVAEISIPFPLIAAGEVHVASSLTAIVIASVPLLGTVLSLRYDPSERPSAPQTLGLLIGFAGVIALVGLDVASSGEQLLGAGAIFLGAIGYAIGPIVVKLGMDGLDPRAVMGASLLIAMVLLAPFAAADLPHRTPTVGALAAVVTLGLICTAAAFVVYTVLIREIGTARATVITYVNPLVALALGVSLLGERPGPGALIGLALILGGSWLSARRSAIPGAPAPTPTGAAHGPAAGAAAGGAPAQPPDGQMRTDRLVD
jgi:drug/metabolite transporter (DMT)-like permease